MTATPLPAPRTGPVVVTDVRFPNEADLIDEFGGHTVRVLRPSAEVDDTHPSETALDHYPVDLTIENVGTLEDLQAKARDLMLSSDL